jgi:hypothetical protein
MKAGAGCFPRLPRLLSAPSAVSLELIAGARSAAVRLSQFERDQLIERDSLAGGFERQVAVQRDGQAQYELSTVFSLADRLRNLFAGLLEFGKDLADDGHDFAQGCFRSPSVRGR